MVWQVIGWILLSLLAFVLVLMVVPVTVAVQVGKGGLLVKVRVLFVQLTVWPRSPRPQKKKPAKQKKEKPKDEAEKQKKPKKEKTRAQKIDMVKRLIAAAKSAMRVVLRHVRLHAVQLEVPVHAADAAETAKRCGQFQAVVGSANAVLSNTLHLKWKRVQIYPDFAGQMQERLFFACKVSFCPVIMLVAGVVFLKKYLSGRRYSKALLKKALREKQAAQAAQNGGPKAA